MLEIINVSKTYKTKTVLQPVSFALAEGECLAVAGHNGSGKSTLLSIVAQVLRSDSGDIVFNGQSVVGDRQFLRTSLGYVPQRNALLPDLTVAETLRYWYKVYRLQSEGMFSPSSFAAMLGLDAVQNQRVGALSGGTQKRVSITLSVLHSPRFLLLDEAFPSLDRQYRNRMADWLIWYKQQGHGILNCSHETEELYTFCDRVLLLRGGNIAFYDAASAFPTEPAVLDTLFSAPV